MPCYWTNRKVNSNRKFSLLIKSLGFLLVWVVFDTSVCEKVQTKSTVHLKQLLRHSPWKDTTGSHDARLKKILRNCSSFVFVRTKASAYHKNWTPHVYKKFYDHEIVFLQVCGSVHQLEYCNKYTKTYTALKQVVNEITSIPHEDCIKSYMPPSSFHQGEAPLLHEEEKTNYYKKLLSY